ncbi:MAG: hypothetical protein ACREJB_12570, partial [Planctomycetaceae bacterium]
TSPESPPMMRLRFWTAVMIGWLFWLFNIERIHEPINLASFVYVLAAACAMAVIFWRALDRAPLWWLLAGAFGGLVVLKAWLDYPITGSALPFTVTEACAVGLTIALASRVAGCLGQFEEGAREAACIRLSDRSVSFESGEQEIYREIRRARQYHRPLMLLAVSPTATSVRQSTSRLLADAQRETARAYITARIADVLSREASDCDIITCLDDRFFVLLPEAETAHAREIAERIVATAAEELGLELRIGTASFPAEEVTFTGLMERAEAGMQPAELTVDIAFAPAEPVSAPRPVEAPAT